MFLDLLTSKRQSRRNGASDIYIFFSSVIVGYMVGSYPLRMGTCIELVVSFSSWGLGGKNLGSLSMIDRSLIVSLDKREKKRCQS